jgi:CDP-diacylglycerol--glycerol-3-phosphate 3-phosphatidyltransferase
MIAAPVLVFLILNRQTDIYKWLLGFSFFTDLVDGWLARKFKVTSVLGAKLDSIADDLTVVAGLTGVIVLKPEFIKQHIWLIILLLALFVFQIILALIRYGKMSSFHTYTAKLAALLQGCFLILFFFLPEPVYSLFYITVFITAIDLIEEIILVLLLPEWKTNVQGLYWVIKKERLTRS